jgi:hypothetical protein
MTSYTGTITSQTTRTGRASPIAPQFLRGIAGRIATAFSALREAVASTQLGPASEQTASRWAGARA